MHKNNKREWFLNVPWGKMAMVSWGDSSHPPVLMVHGMVDTAATFYPLIELLPASYYYVSFDLPGHGRSDSIPGPPMSYVHFVEAVRRIVEQMRWNTFYSIAHSMGYLICVYYNAACPGKMSRLVAVTGMVTIGVHAMIDFQRDWFEMTQGSYYRRYYPPPAPKTYSYEEAVHSLVKKRRMSQAQAEAMATRCLDHTSDGKVRFTWDTRVTKMFSIPITVEIFFAILCSSPPTLYLQPLDDEMSVFFFDFTADMIAKLDKEKYSIVEVPGGHNIHLSQTEFLVPHIVRFLSEDRDFKSKL